MARYLRTVVLLGFAGWLASAVPAVANGLLYPADGASRLGDALCAVPWRLTVYSLPAALAAAVSTVTRLRIGLSPVASGAVAAVAFFSGLLAWPRRWDPRPTSDTLELCAATAVVGAAHVLVLRRRPER